MSDPAADAMAEADAELAEAQRRVSAAWNELTHAQNAVQRAQQKWLEAKAYAKKDAEASHEPPKPDSEVVKT